jgi:hypothetical protein
MVICESAVAFQLLKRSKAVTGLFYSVALCREIPTQDFKSPEVVFGHEDLLRHADSYG